MGWIFDAETGVKRVSDLTKIEPVTFRGVDCAVLAERYAAYWRSTRPEDMLEDPEVIRMALTPSSENV
jgi:hypothetical protein